MRRVVYAGLMAVVVMTCGAMAAAGQAPKGGAAKAKADGKTLQNPVPTSEASVKAGRLVFVKYCAPCHGNSGKGNGGNGTDD